MDYENRGMDSFLYHAPVRCAWCIATGFVEGNACPACDGLGYVVVLHPAMECSACKGTGKPDSSVATRCILCAGCGWLTGGQGLVSEGKGAWVAHSSKLPSHS